MPPRSCRVTIRDMDGVSHTVEVMAVTLYEAVGLRALRGNEWLVTRAQAGTRFSLLLIGVFAVIAVVLAGVGLYGVLSTVVLQRTAEIGVRMALGAQPAGIFQLIVGEALGLTGVGIVAGLIAAFGLTRLMTTMLVG
jgi:putative ABC transport system permease protein